MDFDKYRNLVTLWNPVIESLEAQINATKSTLQSLSERWLQERAKQRRLYRDREAEIVCDFKRDLEAEFKTKGHPKADKLFDKAWEEGHSNSLQEVHKRYQELVELLS